MTPVDERLRLSQRQRVVGRLRRRLARLERAVTRESRSPSRSSTTAPTSTTRTCVTSSGPTTAEAQGKPGVDDDGNGYVDDLHGWDFVDDDAVVAPQGECVGRASHGTFMASLIAAERNNGAGIAAAGSDGARVMVLRIVGCGGGSNDERTPQRLDPRARLRDTDGREDPELQRALGGDDPRARRRLCPDSRTTLDRPRPSSSPACRTKAKPRRDTRPPILSPRIVRAVPIGNDNIISPGTSAAPAGLNLGAPSACVLGATAGRRAIASSTAARIRPRFYPGFSQVSGPAHPMLDSRQTSFWRRSYGNGCPKHRAARSRICRANTLGSAASRRVYTRDEAKKRKRVPRARTATGAVPMTYTESLAESARHPERGIPPSSPPSPAAAPSG